MSLDEVPNEALADEPAEAALARLDKTDELVAARKAVHRRSLAAAAALLIGPVNFVVQAIVLWGDGWPPMGLPVLLVMIVATLAMGFWWVGAREDVRRLEAELADLDRPS